MSDVVELNYIIENDIEDSVLYLCIGEKTNDVIGYNNFSIAEKISIGISWWEDNVDEIKTVSCRYFSDKDISSAISKDVIQMFFALIGAKFGLGIAAYVTAIAIRKIIKGWCECDEPFKTV